MVTLEQMSETLGEAIKRRLEELDMSQRELADTVGMAPAQISRIITGNRGTSMENLLLIADALQMKRETLLAIASGINLEPDEDPWVTEHAYVLSLIKSPRLRRLTERMLEGILQDEEKEEAHQTKPRQRPAD